MVKPDLQYVEHMAIAKCEYPVAKRNEGEHSTGLDFSIILGFEAVVQQQLDQIFPFDVSHDWFLQGEENMAQLVAYASKDVGNIMYYHEAINHPDAIEFAKAIIMKLMDMWTKVIGNLFQGIHSRGSNSCPLSVIHAMKA